jgi:aminomethyltransferase
MPLQYGNEGITVPHLKCRNSAALFDVSHMGQIIIRGKDREDFIESLVPGNIKDLKINQVRLTQFTNEKGGILDDLMVSRKDNYLYVVVNAGCAEQDIEYLNKHMENWKSNGKDLNMEVISGVKTSLVALQGPKAINVLQKLVKEDLTTIKFMHTSDYDILGTKGCYITRCGYTGEDGFEISIPNEKAEELCEILISDKDVGLAGLGARDTLRLEASLCLMGSDMNPDITPIEADLAWTIGKRRRDEANFPGAKIILDQLKNGTEKKRIGFKIIEKGGIPREHYKIWDKESNSEIGFVTSGTKTPCLDYPIGMGYVKTNFAKEGQIIEIQIRNKKYGAEIVKMPFIELGFKKI